MVGNILIYLGVVLFPSATFWAVLRIPRLIEKWNRRRPPATSAVPVERLAADLRRVHRALVGLAPDAPMLRRRATYQAYDALLVQACRAVDVPQRLDAVPEGIERDVERLRVEEALRGAGLAIP
ncbi:hypothetical protein DI005_01780 [Prauserella sp. PE36]|uniref:Uncharacterized protein n=1 Tax=Prauserella endophytica TaxID=1592324 RepID=A0ABY2SC47_9PSEU|nr:MULTISPECIES: hypothetical protein [Prauserella]PXY34763.1 hypothetical protein BAY59_04455 [Prauserella coralliicola]RBM23698.1 hypothetical protein DI005_01780 [Prauserella sp. PE36]TKG73296.1 hypothetical protein FCN18_01535 [Prauserella endophytica]